jgi:hypothetical protein
MGEIASISFGEDTSNEPIDAPGFSQDVGFDELIRSHMSPNPSPQKRKAPRVPAFSSFDASPAVNENAPSKCNNPEPEPYQTTEEPELPPLKSASEDPREDVLPEAPVAAPGIGNADKDERTNNEAIADPQEEINKDQGKFGNKPKEAKDDEQVTRNSPNHIETRTGLRTKAELKGPSKELRRFGSSKPLKTYVTPRQSARITKTGSASTSAKSSTSRLKRTATEALMSTPLSSLPTMASSSTKSTPTRSSTRKSATKTTAAKEQTPVPTSTNLRSSRRSETKAKVDNLPKPVTQLARTSAKRASTSAARSVEVTASSTRAKRQSITKPKRESSADPLAGPTPATVVRLDAKEPTALFSTMAFAVSYVKDQQAKDAVTRLIKEGGGQILLDGFDSLFDHSPRPHLTDGYNDLTLSPAATRLGFAALIADEHSRRAKYMQALALGLPCISGRWISACVSKGEVVNWSPYLLCAGQSSFLGNAVRSRTLRPYSALEANFSETFINREKLLGGKSILLVTGKGRGTEEKRKAYVFLARALGPARFEQVVDFEQARKRLLESEGLDFTWDLLYVDHNEAAAESAVFGSSPTSSGGSKKRKRGPIAADDVATPPPKKIRVISDEVVIQSLILGELLD